MAAATSSPEVFISYQWDRQTEVKALYAALVARGWRCWLDILQMGGGDSLYEKIDAGVRGSHVVISCVTAKYALSANCRREVSLADALRKPIIPLLLEESAWPPAGPMALVFTQLLYIKARGVVGKDAGQGKWEGSVLDELQHKLQAHVSQEDKSDTQRAAPPTTPPPEGSAEEIRDVTTRQRQSKSGLCTLL